MLWNNAKAAARGSHGGSQLKIVRVAICTQEIENAPKTGISFICIIFSSLIDPAVGSGAFPLGMLNEIVKARNTLTSYMAIEKNSRQRKDLYIERNPYRFKRETIRDCIFACDIEPSAVDITKLRLWLSLVIDDQIMEIDDVIMDSSTKPRELPNLDCNIICGNSLLDEFMGEKLITKSSALNNLGEYYQGTLYDETVYQTINEIIALQRKLYDEKDHVEKNSLKRQIQERYDNIILEQLKGTDKAEDNYYQAIQKPSRPFILWQLYFPRVFKENGGFDIVIGNPPYVKIQNIDNQQSEILKKNYISATGKYDMYVLFIEKAFSMLSEVGFCAFIHPHRFINVGYGKGIRNYISKRQGLKKFVSFGVNQTFDTATTYTGVFFYQKNSPSILYATSNIVDINNLNFATKNWNDLKEPWSFNEETSNSVVQKILGNNVKLLDVFKGIYQGLITLGDDIFIMEGYIRDDTFYGFSKEINETVEIEADIMKPLLKGENIRRYNQPKNDLFVFYPHVINYKGKTVPLEEDELKNKYPKAFDYISRFKDYLFPKKVKYKTNPKYWYSLHRAREKNLFDSVKIITPQLQNYPNFALDTNSMYTDAGGYILIINNDYKDDVLYYYGILNSSLFYHFITNTSTAFNNNYYYFKTAYIEPFRFPNVSV